MPRIGSIGEDQRELETSHGKQLTTCLSLTADSCNEKIGVGCQLGAQQELLRGPIFLSYVIFIGLVQLSYN